MTRNTSTARLSRAVLIGAGAGVIASLVMAMYAMLAAYAKDTGFFTPLYHIASLVTDDSDMMKSMTADKMDGDAFTFLFGPAILGAVIHMITGAMYGAVFGLNHRAPDVRRRPRPVGRGRPPQDRYRARRSPRPLTHTRRVG